MLIYRNIKSKTDADVLSKTAYELSVRSFDELAKESIRFYESHKEKKRRSVIARKTQMLNNNWKNMLRFHMWSYFIPLSYRAITGRDEHVETSDNLFNDIIDELGVLYQQAPSRRIDGDKDKAKRYEELCGGDLFHQFWLEVNRNIEAYHDVAIWPQVIIDENNEKKIVNHIAPGDRFSVITKHDNPSVVDSLIIRLDSVDNNPRYSFWTKDFHGVFERDISSNEVYQVGPSDHTNPYGRIPYIFCHANVSRGTFWNTLYNDDLVEASLSVGEQRTQMRYSRKMSSFKQLAVSGNHVGDLPSQLRDEGALMKFQGDGISLEQFDWTTDPAKKLSQILELKVAMALSRGINPEKFKDTATYQSNAAMRTGDRGLIERRQRQIPVGKIIEQEYYALVAHIANITGIKGAGEFSPSSKLDIEYAEMSYPVDPLAQRQLDNEDIKLGIKSLPDVAMDRNPTLSRNEAEDIILENIEFQAKIAEIKMRYAIPENLNNRSSIDEENGKNGPEIRDKNKEDSSDK